MVVSSDGKGPIFNNTFGKDQLRELFTLKTSEVLSDTFHSLGCGAMGVQGEGFNEDDLKTWTHTEDIGEN